MIIAFFAKDDLLQPIPYAPTIVNQPAKYVGRSYDSTAKAYPAKELPSKFDSNSREGMRLIRLMQSSYPPLFPADKETADFIGCNFYEIVFADGKWTIKP